MGNDIYNANDKQNEKRNAQPFFAEKGVQWYHSTRDAHVKATASEAILQGLAPDGGLYVPDHIPQVDFSQWMDWDYRTMCRKVLSLYLNDFTKREVDEAVEQAYSGKFDVDDLVDIKFMKKLHAGVEALDSKNLASRNTDAGHATLGHADCNHADASEEKAHPIGFLELFHGPTRAFKDMALSLLPQLMTRAAKKDDKKILILVATSGDTGKAAMEGFADVPGVEVVVFYPHGGVSPVQLRQMMTQRGDNVYAFAIEGNFDDAQTGVKQIFRDQGVAQALAKQNTILSSANSINIGRLIPQIVYYIYGYSRFMKSKKISYGETVDVVVPTGNFGNILAASYAKEMGLPVGRLLCAANDNHVLADFFQTGVYDRRRKLLLTSSPSMDILISSNLERYLYLRNPDTAAIRARMQALQSEGVFSVDPETLGVVGTWANEAEVTQAIRDLYDSADHYLVDPHTAVAYAALQKIGVERPTLVVSTASPYKFVEKVWDSVREKDWVLGRENVLERENEKPNEKANEKANEKPSVSVPVDKSSVQNLTESAQREQAERLSQFTNTEIPLQIRDLWEKMPHEEICIAVEEMADVVLHRETFWSAGSKDGAVNRDIDRDMDRDIDQDINRKMTMGQKMGEPQEELGTGTMDGSSTIPQNNSMAPRKKSAIQEKAGAFQENADAIQENASALQKKTSAFQYGKHQLHLRVRVPATSANLGPGFDCLGVALDRYNYFDFRWRIEGLANGFYAWDEGWKIAEDNLIRKAYAHFEAENRALPPFRLYVKASIPSARGLGSSATCIAAGLVAADWMTQQLFDGPKCSDEEMLRMATAIEGHPDNVAPALFGGLRLSVSEGDRVACIALPVATEVTFLTIVPAFPLATAKSREVLPEDVPFADAVSNAKRIGFLLDGLRNGDIARIRYGAKDRLHEPYRRKLIPGYELVEKVLEAHGYACVLSGAGPTILGIGIQKTEKEDEKVLRKIQKELPAEWKAYRNDVDFNGAQIEKMRATI